MLICAEINPMRPNDVDKISREGFLTRIEAALCVAAPEQRDAGRNWDKLPMHE